ncbi:MAG: hypothetical protein M1818_007354 [Claussenomyces sp. TS43310]|nr:MAG: hypothetical protein M1818_007354 [Claussenomyces sp. TS43310]
MASLLLDVRSNRYNITDPSMCTVDTCPINSSYYYYRVSLAANVVFLCLFSLSLIAFILTYGLTRRALAFSVAFFCGVILEVLGYVGRILSWHDQWTENGFLMQIVCLTIAPAFMAGGIYLCLRRIVYAFGPDNSRITPESYTRIAAGGGLASAESHENKSSELGDHIMVAGLAFQVLTLFVFICLCIDFAIRTRRRFASLGEAAFDQNALFVSLRGSWRFKGFLAALTLATICIFWRSVFRVAELSEGWSGAIIRKQNLFIGFEGVMVIVACLSLNFFHPALCFKEGITGLGGLGSSRKAKGLKQPAQVAGGMSASSSEVERSTEKPVV